MTSAKRSPSRNTRCLVSSAMCHGVGFESAMLARPPGCPLSPPPVRWSFPAIAGNDAPATRGQPSRLLPGWPRKESSKWVVHTPSKRRNLPSVIAFSFPGLPPLAAMVGFNS